MQRIIMLAKKIPKCLLQALGINSKTSAKEKERNLLRSRPNLYRGAEGETRTPTG